MDKKNPVKSLQEGSQPFMENGTSQFYSNCDTVCLAFV